MKRAIIILASLFTLNCISSINYNEQELIHRQNIVSNSLANLKVDQRINEQKIIELRRQLDREIYFQYLLSVEVHEFLSEHRQLIDFFDSLESGRSLLIGTGSEEDPLHGVLEDDLGF